MDTNQIDAFIARCDIARPEDTELAEAIKSSGIDRTAWCEKVALYIAQEYSAHRLEYLPADSAMNRLWEYGFLVDDAFLSELTQEIFHAFDAGEYHHSGDQDTVDSSEKYTRPRVSEILLGLASVNVA